MIPETVSQKLDFAKNRLRDLKNLIANNQLASDPKVRHQITQEFFFHLLGATEYLAQLINERRGIGIISDEVALYKVVKKLELQDPADAVIPYLQSLCANTKREPFPDDPYSEKGLIYRIINYRNEIVHRNMNPFHFVMSEGPKVAFFWLDPRNHARGYSKCTVYEDLSNMYSLVDQKCCNTLAILA